MATALAGVLTDPVPAVRAEAAFALGQLQQGSREIEVAPRPGGPAGDGSVREKARDRGAGQGRTCAGGRMARAPACLGPGGCRRYAGAGTHRRTRRGDTAPVPGARFAAQPPRSGVREVAAWGLANALRESSWAAWSDQVYQALDGYERTDRAAVQLLRAVLRLPDRLPKSGRAPGSRSRRSGGRAWRRSRVSPRPRSPRIVRPC